jgi:hypothetical protein
MMTIIINDPVASGELEKAIPFGASRRGSMRTKRSHHPADTTDVVASVLTVHTQGIASRRIGTGQPLLLCLRLRGVPITARIAQRWKTGTRCARLPTPHAATSM